MLRTKNRKFQFFRGGIPATLFKNQEYGAFNAFVDSRAVTACTTAKWCRQD